MQQLGCCFSFLVHAILNRSTLGVALYHSPWRFCTPVAYVFTKAALVLWLFSRWSLHLSETEAYEPLLPEKFSFSKASAEQAEYFPDPVLAQHNLVLCIV